MGKNENGVLEPGGRLKVAKPPERKSLALLSISGGAERPNPASPGCGSLASYWPPLGVSMKGKNKEHKGPREST